MRKWIKCDLVTPDNHRDVLVFCIDEIYIAYWDSNACWYRKIYKGGDDIEVYPSVWMDLPAPPPPADKKREI
jgi:hypothetical protein